MFRASAPAIGTVALVGVVVALALAVAASLTGVEPPAPAPASKPRLALVADAGADRLTLVHQGGDSLDTEACELTVRVDGTALTHQPPVPFFAATGFESGPTGAFNAAGSTTLRPGEHASLQLAETNAPALTPGARVTVRVATEEAVLAELETTA